MQRIVFLDRDTLDADLRRPVFIHEWVDYAHTQPQEVAARLVGATMAISNKVVLRREVLEQASALRLIAVCATGTDPIDLDYGRARGIAVANIRGYAVHAVPEHVFMLVLALRRNLIAYRDDVRAGRWQAADRFCLTTHPIHDLAGATFGVIGYGALGQACARLAQAFGMHVLIAEHKDAPATRPGYTAFADVLMQADVISLHVPLTPTTRHLVGAAELGRMKPTAILINTARGGVVDEAALAQALSRGRIGGAGFDVLSAEPPPGDNPLLRLNLPNFILTPHNAWASVQAQQKVADELIANLEAFERGAARNRVL